MGASASMQSSGSRDAIHMGWKWAAYYLLLATGATPPFRPRAHDNGTLSTLSIGDLLATQSLAFVPVGLIYHLRAND